MQTLPLILLCGGMMILFAAASFFSKNDSLSRIKSKQVGDGQHGTARWASKREIWQTCLHIPFTPAILLIAEFCPPEHRHIVSVFKIIQELLELMEKGKPNRFQALMMLLPADHNAKWFAGAALSSAGQAMQSVLSTAMARLNSFLDSELESILCFQTDIDAERFCKRKSAIFLTMPEEFNTRYFLISLIVQ